MEYVLDLSAPEGLEEQRHVTVEDEELLVQVTNDKFQSTLVVDSTCCDTRTIRFRGEDWIVVDEVGAPSDEEGVEVPAFAPISSNILHTPRDAVRAVSSADEEPAPVTKRSRRECDLCSAVFDTRVTRGHYEHQHFPWFYCPYASCPECQVSEQTLCFLRQRHLWKSCISGFATDNDLLTWLARITAVLHRLKEIFNAGSLEGLRQLVVRRGYSELDYAFHAAWEGCLLQLDNYLGLPRHDSHKVHNPQCVASILHWRTMANLLKACTPAQQEDIRRLDAMADRNGLCTAPPSHGRVPLLH